MWKPAANLLKKLMKPLSHTKWATLTLRFKPVTVILFYSVLHMSGIYQRVSWKLNGCTSIFTSLQQLWSCFMNWIGTTLSGKTNKLNVLQNWKKSGNINNDIIIQPHPVQQLLFSNASNMKDRAWAHFQTTRRELKIRCLGEYMYFWQTAMPFRQTWMLICTLSTAGRNGFQKKIRKQDLFYIPAKFEPVRKCQRNSFCIAFSVIL